MSQPTTEPTQPDQASGSPQQTPPAQPGQRWREGEYDPARAASLIANLEKERDALKDRATKYDEAERAKLGDVERLNGDVASLTSRAEKAERELAQIVAGVNAGLTVAQSKRLSGEKAEDFEADAKAFAAELGIKAPGETTDTGTTTSTEEPPAQTGKDISNHRGSTSTGAAAPAPTQRPADATPRGGRAPEAEPVEDMRAIVDAIPR